MNTDIRLTEHEKARFLLNPAQVAAISRELSGKVEVYPTDEPGLYELKAGSHVGFAALPGERLLVIQPKVPIETVFALLAAVYDPEQELFRDQPQPYTTIESLFEFVVAIFATHVEDLIARGILRGYRPTTEDLIALRGRLLLVETFHRRPALRDRHWCSFSHFTADLAENRILRWTSFCLQPYRYLETKLAGRLRRIVRGLSDVLLEPECRQHFQLLEFHRLNDPYRPALMLARLLLDHLTFSGTAGGESFLAYLIDMNTLFEDYVGAVLKKATLFRGLSIDEQKPCELDIGGQVKIKPDVVLAFQNQPILVLDAKYKLEAHYADLYQALAYCHALGLPAAVLVHPASEQAPTGTIDIRGPGNIRVHYFPLDLRGGPIQLQAQSHAFAAQVHQLLTTHQPDTYSIHHGPQDLYFDHSPATGHHAAESVP